MNTSQGKVQPALHAGRERPGQLVLSVQKPENTQQLYRSFPGYIRADIIEPPHQFKLFEAGQRFPYDHFLRTEADHLLAVPVLVLE
jgi:antibiotic biosynthesis monooxygenase (ABM) superfamily enzyme